ncbi:hypothetical protein FWC31_02820 [Candidatus Saccharibacteria bacterium]|nr:hypothetical protein [Candidatus Saccharibacteria bacterium]
MNEKSPRSQLVTKIKDTNNVLVTVSRNPNVDQLAAALGLTFVLDKMGKHATAVFSGEIPPAINFLEPEKTFEGTVDSLRDFVISLDKEKADRLRYKVEGDLVKIYITPYKTTISEKDLEFNEGDFNIELVVAVGVEQKDYLDEAITAHGRLLHDATVATLALGEEGKNTFGTINWQEIEASSLSEMVANLVDDLSDKENQLLDEQIATALLTGVVAATDQFRNEKTSANVMTLAASLMAKGANQQLIASELSASDKTPAADSDSTEIEETEETKETEDQPEPETPETPETLMINRNLTPEADIHIATDAKTVAEEHNRDALSTVQERLAAITNTRDATSPESEVRPNSTRIPASINDTIPKPSSVFAPELPPASSNSTITPATSDETELDVLMASNKTITNHASPYVESSIGAPLNSAIANSDEPPTIDPFATNKPPAPISTVDTITSVPPLTVPPFTSPNIELPPPPPPPPPPSGLGQLPPLPTTPPTTDPMFPQLTTNPSDPTEYQIPN